MNKKILTAILNKYRPAGKWECKWQADIYCSNIAFNKHAFRANPISVIPRRNVSRPIDTVEERCPLIVRDTNLQTVEVRTGFPATANLLHKGR